MPTQARVHIRWLCKADLNELAWIDDASFVDPWTQQLFRRYYSTKGIILVPELIGVRVPVAGYLAYRLPGGRVELDRMAVHPDFRRLGVGAALVDNLKSKLDLEFRPIIACTVNEHSLPMQLFLRAQGFLCTEVIRGEEEGDGYRFVYAVPA